MLNKKIKISAIVLLLLFSYCTYSHADRLSREERKKKQLDELQKRFE